MKKNVAIIGYGGQGAWHAKQILTNQVVNLAGIYDIKQERNDLAAGNGIKVYSSLEEICADKSVDLCVVATPNQVHEEIVINLLKNGKNVVCEKPVTLTLESFDRMAKVANETGKFFTVHQNRRWDVDYLAIKQIIASNKIGAPMHIESRVQGSRGIPCDWRGKKEFGGGILFDWGVHLIDQMLQLVPEKITNLFCKTTHYTNNEVDDGFRLSLTFQNGITAYVEVTTYNFLALPRFYLLCQKGTALINDWRQNAHIAYCKAWNEKEVLPIQTAAGITKTMSPRDEITLDEYDWQTVTSDAHDFYRNVAKVLDGEEESLIKLSEVRRVLQVITDAKTSAENEIAISYPEGM